MGGLEHKDLLDGLYIPPPPKLINDIYAADLNLVVIAKLIATDAAVSAQVLQTVNSAAFGLRKRIGSIQQATVLLGFNTVINIVNTVLLRQMAKKINLPALETFWDTATDVALCSAYLAGIVKSVPPDEAYALGLFHNCGIPLVLHKFPNYLDVLTAAYAGEDGDISGVEEANIGVSHADVSYLVAKAWRLPEHMCNATEYHHDLSAEDFHSSMIEDPVAMDHLAILKMSEHLCKLYSHLGGQTEDHEWRRLEDAIFEYTGVSESKFYELEDDIDALLAKM